MSDDLKIMCEYLPKSMKFKTKSERLVCAVMMFYANRNKSNGFEFSIPMVEIAKITCISKYTVCNAVNKLVDDGVFDVVRKGNSVSKKSTLYRLNRTVKPNSRVVDTQGVTDDIELFGYDDVERGVKVNSNGTVKPNSRVVDTQGVTDDIELFGNDDVERGVKVNSNGTVKPNSRVVDTQGVTDKTEQFGETDGLEQKVNTNYNYNYNYKKNDNKEYGLTTINDNKRNDMIGDVNNVSVERLLDVLERLVVSVDEMNRNIYELKTIVSQQRETVNALETTNRNPFSSKLECSVQSVAVDNTNHQGENDIEQPKEGVDTDRESNGSEVETTSPFLSQPIEVVKKEISWAELDRNPHTANTQPAQITTSPIQQGVEMVSNSCATEDDINDAIGSITLKTTNQSSRQENITNLWNELRGGDNPEQIYSQLEELFNCGLLTDRQWETTNRIRRERLDAVKTTSNQKKKKEKKVDESANKTLMYFPDEQMKIFNEGVLTFYNACKTALDQERKEGKAFDEEKYIEAFNIYAQNFDELSNSTDKDGNKYGDYDYLKRKVYMNPFVNRCDATTREICERYQSIQANRQAVVNA